ncbi:MAG: diguanylate cyclase [Pseudomonadales bacterium]
MKMNWSLAKINPITQISVGIVCLTASLLFISELFGLIPNSQNAELESRKKFAEVFAIQLSSLAYRGHESTIESTLKLLVEKNDDLESAAIRTSGRNYVFGEHEQHWSNQENIDGESEQLIPTQISVPIFRDGLRWGLVELRFAEAELSGWMAWVKRYPTLALVAFVTLFGFMAYRLFMKRALRELDPSAAIPDRVKTAFDALAEGVLIIDEQRSIVLANSSFIQFAQMDAEELIGKSPDMFDWAYTEGGEQAGSEELPWNAVFDDARNRTGIRLFLHDGSGEERVFMVNCVPIHDGGGEARGVLATFDDVSELEEKNNHLRVMLGKLQMSQQRVQAQNAKLHLLATRDPMTNCLNRRSFYTEFEQKFVHARNKNEDLTAIMVDIDHFKSINDSFGHSAGDEVIKILAKVLHDNARECDLVARYGGEEFAIVLEKIDSRGAESIATRIGKALAESDAVEHTEGKVITASLGVASITHGAKDKEALLDEADQALYVAKETGRNRVVCFSPEMQSEHAGKAETENVPAELRIAANDGSDANTTDEVNAMRSRLQELEQLAEDKEHELEALISFDSLTGFKRRDPFHESIGQAIVRGYRYEQLTAVLSIGVTSYRTVSDTLGFELADTMLAEIAQRLESVLRSSDSLVSSEGDNSFADISRLGSDEFGLLLSELNNKDAIDVALQRFITAITKPLQLGDVTVEPICAIGVSVFPDDGSYAELLTHNAAVARQHAVAVGADYCLYSPEQEEHAQELLQQGMAS